MNLTSAFSKFRHAACCLVALCSIIFCMPEIFAKDGVPDSSTINSPFGEHDRLSFLNPPRVHYPETWFHFIGGNVSKEGITADLEAIAESGISGIQFFHGQFGDKWPATGEPITCLSDGWYDAVRHISNECKRLGLRFSMQNCPGWAMAGGPWISEDNAMRFLVSSTACFDTSDIIDTMLPMPEPSSDFWRDYREIAVIAFPTPEGGDESPLRPIIEESSSDIPWSDLLNGSLESIQLPPASKEGYQATIRFDGNPIIRSIVFPAVGSISPFWCYEPGVRFSVVALKDDNSIVTLIDTDLPQANWQDESPLTFACPDVDNVSTYKITIKNDHDINLRNIRFLSAARKNNWEAEAAVTLRDDFLRDGYPTQAKEAYLKSSEIMDISRHMNSDGTLNWTPPHPGKWTVMRFGHVNAGRQNGPAPAEGTGWECDKLSPKGAEAHFAGYIGKITDETLASGSLNGMLLDSWECGSQTWTPEMETYFIDNIGYALRNWLPALSGYVIDTPETTSQFLCDWRKNINKLFTENFFCRISELAHEKGLSVAYETAGGDVFPADILQYYKYADIPMCEFWNHPDESFVGSLNFKPAKPTASAAHIYGKPRVAAESFTSFYLTWDEHWQDLKEIADFYAVEGVTHNVFHTYTHNPQVGFLPPGSSFGSGIGTPFLRGQTWWPYMRDFTAYLARCSYMLERGRPVADVLWYLGDEYSHKPDQHALFPDGYRYDYCNSDVLLNRLSVSDGRIVTPEGLEYSILWLPDNQRMHPESLTKIRQLIADGATVVGNAPENISTLSPKAASYDDFTDAISGIWGGSKAGIPVKIGKGTILSGMPIDTALASLGLRPDVIGDIRWIHRQTDGADWYFVTPRKGKKFNGIVSFLVEGDAEIWDPLTGKATQIKTTHANGYSSVDLNLSHGESAFIVFDRTLTGTALPQLPQTVTNVMNIDDGREWTLKFPDGWDMPAQMTLNSLSYWKDLPLSDVAKAFSGTATYTTDFEFSGTNADTPIFLDLGDVDMIARVSVNGTEAGTVWCNPYKLDITNLVKEGNNSLKIEVTSTWFNRLVYDASLPEDQRRTWTINGPSKDEPLRTSGLRGPVRILY